MQSFNHQTGLLQLCLKIKFSRSVSNSDFSLCSTVCSIYLELQSKAVMHTSNIKTKLCLDSSHYIYWYYLKCNGDVYLVDWGIHCDEM